jgi:hypothetical protein
VQLVTCKPVKARGHKTRQKCTTKLVSGSVKFRVSSSATHARATLSRRGRTYATGGVSKGRVVLHATRSVPHGAYTLRLTYRNAGGLRTIHSRVRIT